MNLFKKIIIILIVVSSFALGQSPYNIEYNEVKGSLKSSDKYKKDFGKYRGFEFELFEGEKANFAVFSSDFNARMILVDPNGKVFKQTDLSREGMASIITEIPVSGGWILYVIGNQNDLGEFSLYYAFASSNSLNISNNMDLCSSLNFLIAHASANFMMLPFDQLYSSGMELIGREDLAVFDERNGSLIITKYTGADEKQAKAQYLYLIQQIGNCLGDWEISDFVQKNEKHVGKIFKNKADEKAPIIFVELITENSTNRLDTLSYKALITIK